MFKIIACINKKGVLGKDGKLIYHIGNDLKNFAAMTKFNGVLVMGRSTYESLPNGEPLKDRINIVLTTNKDYSIDSSYGNVYIANSIQEVLDLCNAFFPNKELFVIGGASIYSQFMEMGIVDEMRLTIVEDDTDGDVFFPKYDANEWYLYYETMHQTSFENENKQTFYFQVLKKKREQENK